MMSLYKIYINNFSLHKCYVCEQAEKLEIAVGERNQEILRLRKALGGRGRTPVMNNLSSQHWFSTDSMASLGVSAH